MLMHSLVFMHGIQWHNAVSDTLISPDTLNEIN